MLIEKQCPNVYLNFENSEKVHYNHNKGYRGRTQNYMYFKGVVIRNKCILGENKGKKKGRSACWQPQNADEKSARGAFGVLQNNVDQQQR